MAVLTFTQNVSTFWSDPAPLFSPYLSHTWSLAVEEQFYLVWPALVLMSGRRHVAWLSLACLAGSVLARSQGTSTILLVARGDGLALGGLLAAILARYSPEGPRRGALLTLFGVSVSLSAIPLVAYGLFSNPDAWGVLEQAGRVLAFNTFWFGVVGLIVCGSGRPSLGVLRLRPLCKLGLFSYGLYLYHWPILLFGESDRLRLGLPRPTVLAGLHDADHLLRCGLAVIDRYRAPDHAAQRPVFLRTDPHFNGRPPGVIEVTSGGIACGSD